MLKPPPTAPPPPPGLTRVLSPPPGLPPRTSAVDVLGLTAFTKVQPLSIVAQCKAPPKAASCTVPAYVGDVAFIAQVRACLREAEVPETCWCFAVDWVMQEQAVKISEILDNLEEIAKFASIRKLPLQRLKLRLIEEEMSSSNLEVLKLI